MINAQVDTGDSVTVQLKSALLFYQTQANGVPARSYIEMRPVIQGEHGPIYGAGRPAQADEVRRLLDDHGHGAQMNVLDPRLLCVRNEEAAWWSRPAKHAPIFSSSVKGMKTISGVDVPMPALVFHVRDNVLRVRAVRTRGRPKATTPLFVAPLWNVYTHGGLCMGSMHRPAGRPLEQIDAWEKAFWDSAFNTCHDPRACGRPGTYAAMLRALRKRDRFPAEWLTPSHQTLQQWLNAR